MLHDESRLETIPTWTPESTAPLREGPRGTTEVPNVWEGSEPRASTHTITTLSDHGIAPPNDGETALRDLEREEDDDGGDGDTCRESGGDDVVVFRPETEVPLPDVLEGEPSDVDVSDVEGHVVRRSPS